MNTFFIILFSLLITQRLSELSLAHHNARWMKAHGGFEVGGDHYKYIVLIHVGFLASLLAEVALGETTSPSWWMIPFGLFIVAQALRYWCIFSLGKFWNTRIYILPDHSLVKKGPYRWIRHPNYLIVMVEMIAFPIIFGAYSSSVIWSTINFLFLWFVRIPTEEHALHIRVERQE